MQGDDPDLCTTAHLYLHMQSFFQIHADLVVSHKSSLLGIQAVNDIKIINLAYITMIITHVNKGVQ